MVKPGRSRRVGMTLLEVLVALAILGVALVAALRATAVTTDNAATLRERLLADWVARNRLEWHRAQRSWLPPGSQNGTQMQAGVPFVWTETVSTTPNNQFRRLEVVVRGQDGAAVRLSGYLTHPL